MIQAIIQWLAGQLLSMLLRRAEEEVGRLLKQAEELKQRQIRDEENEKKYREAQDREARIRAATNLLNRNAG